MKFIKGNTAWFKAGERRLDSSFHLSQGRVTRSVLEASSILKRPLRELTSKVFYGGRSKRVYVSSEKFGVPFMGSSDMLRSNFNSLKYISRKQTKNLDGFLLKKEWTLVSRSGTIGNTSFTNDDFENKAASEHMIRIVSNDEIKSGYLYSFLSSKYGYSLMTQGTFGAVIQHIEPNYLLDLPIPILSKAKEEKIHQIIIDSSKLRVEANKILIQAQSVIKEEIDLKDLETEQYDYFGSYSENRKTSIFSKNIREIDSLTINAFNHSSRTKKIKKSIEKLSSLPLEECLNNRRFFSTGSFRRLEIDSPMSIKLINQSDIYHFKKKGKMLARKFVNTSRLVEYGEVLIAGVGTLGENETFCRAFFANEELNGQLISGEFIRMKTNNIVPSGYLFSWLSSDYGFRLIRSTQTGTKLCRPIQELLKDIPVPILEKSIMKKIDSKVKEAHTMIYQALQKENEAIALVEKEIEEWEK